LKIKRGGKRGESFWQRRGAAGLSIFDASSWREFCRTAPLYLSGRVAGAIERLRENGTPYKPTGGNKEKLDLRGRKCKVERRSTRTVQKGHEKGKSVRGEVKSTGNTYKEPRSKGRCTPSI